MFRASLRRSPLVTRPDLHGRWNGEPPIYRSRGDGDDSLRAARSSRITNTVWSARRAVMTRKMIALTFRRVLERLMSDAFLLLKSVAPAIPTPTAAMRARRMRCLFEVRREIGFARITPPVRSSLYGGNHDLSSIATMILKRVRRTGRGRGYMRSITNQRIRRCRRSSLR
jgi:hypothetical protein